MHSKYQIIIMYKFQDVIIIHTYLRTIFHDYKKPSRPLFARNMVITSYVRLHGINLF